MKFSGRLQIETEPLQWLKTDLSMAQGRLELTSGSEILGSWSMSQVKAERIDGDRFELLLGDDRALFAADDALAFSYEALPHLSKKHIIAGPTGLRGRLRNGRRGAERHEAEQSNREAAHAKMAEAGAQVASVPAPVNGEAEASDLPVANHPVARRLRELIQAASQEAALQETSGADLEQAWPEETAQKETGPTETGPTETGPKEYGRTERGPAASEQANHDSANHDSPNENFANDDSAIDDSTLDEWSELDEPAAAAELASIEPRWEAAPIASEFGESEVGKTEIADFALEEIEIQPLEAADLDSIELEAAELANDFWARPTDLAPEPQPAASVRPPQSSAHKLDLEPAFGKASGPDNDDPEARVMVAIEGILAEVRNGSLSPAQVSAVTDLVQAVTDFVGARRS